MRQFIYGLCLLLPALPAHATTIELGPNFYILQEAGPSFTIDNFEIGTRTTNTSVSGSGSAVSIVDDWDNAEIRASLGTGPGEATASLVNTSTFDLVFDEPGDVFLSFGFGLDGLGSEGFFIADPGDSLFVSWEMFVDVEGFPGLISYPEFFVCDGDHTDEFGCFSFFDSSEVGFGGTLTDDLRLSVSTVMRFDIGVSRAAAVVPEPGMLAILLLSLAWVGRRTLVIARARR